MPYRAPGAYARFVRTASAVSNAGSTRIMGLVGTGLNYYEVYNEPVTKAKDRPYDTLTYPNVMEILSVTDRPVYFGKSNPDTVYYVKGDYELKDGQHIVWKGLGSQPVEPELINVTATSPFLNDGCEAFNEHINIMVDGNNGYLVEDGEWMIEVTYVAKEGGCYRIINNLTKELVGEYAVGPKAVTAIPGCLLTITSTFTAPEDATPESEESVIAVGDYVIFKTSATKTEVEAGVSIDTKLGLGSRISEIKVINPEKVVSGSYNLRIVDAAAKKFVIETAAATPVLVYPTVGTATVGETTEFFDIIPGISFEFGDIDYTGADDGDKVVFTTVARQETDGVPGERQVYYVSYKYRKPDADYAPKIFYDYDDVVNEYGNYDVTASGFVLNSLSLGAEIAFTNGLQRIVCVQARGTSDLEMKAAIDLLKRTLPGVDNINTIIPLTSSADVGAYAMKHVDLMSSYDQGKERMVYLGAALNQPMTKNPTAADRSIGMIEMAKSYANERVVFVVPGEIVKDIRDLRTGRTNERKLPAAYAAIAVASLGLVNDPAEPLTNKQIAGFKYIPQVLMESEKNDLAAAGCCVLEQRGSSVIRVRHGITTSTTEVNSSEITLIQIKDYVIDACRKSTAALYVGQKNRPSVLADVQYTITSILNQFISQEVIIGFSGLSVKRSKDDPRQIDVKFEIEAVYPLNYINITFGFSAVS